MMTLKGHVGVQRGADRNLMMRSDERRCIY